MTIIIKNVSNLKIEWTDRVEFLNTLEQSGFLFWLTAIIGMVLIWGLGLFFIRLINKAIRSDRVQTVVNKVGTWVLLFISMMYIFSFLGESNWMTREIVTIGDTEVTPMLIIVIIFALVVAFKLSNTIRHYLLPPVYDRYEIDRGPRATINTLLHYTIIIVMIAFSLSSLGFNFSSLTVFAGVVGVGVGFGLKNIMNNFISGLIILFDRTIEVGDRVVIDDTFTDIEEIKIRYTIVRTRLNERIIIPNSYFLENKFINRSFTNKRLRVTIEVGVEYGEDLDLAEEELIESIYDLQATKYGRLLSNPLPEVYVENFDEYNVSLVLFFWIDDQAEQAEFVLPSEARKIIYKRFYEAGVSFAFPRQDLFLLNKQFEEQAK